jgi:Pirin C-terminal cupin domain
MAQVNILPTETSPTGSGTVQQVAEVGTVGRARASEAAALAVQCDAPSTAVSGTVIAFPGVTLDDTPPRRQYLTEREVEQLCAAARKRGRYGHCDATMVLMAYRHGLRVSEVPSDHAAYVYVFEGAVRVGGREVEEGQLAVLGEGDSVHFAATHRAQVLLLTGVPLREPVVQYGPFVMNTEREIAQAIDDYQAGRLGEIAR